MKHETDPHSLSHTLSLPQLKAAQSKRQEMSDQILQTAVTNCDKEPAFEEKKAKLREKVLHLTDLKNDHSRRFGELSEYKLFSVC